MTPTSPRGTCRVLASASSHARRGAPPVYVFDNSGANATIFRLKHEADPDYGNDTAAAAAAVPRDDLRAVTDLFPPSRVTRINWPATICNNNRPAHHDPGERSSQYAAEAACRTRYGPHADWMASLDPDEYLVPMGDHAGWPEVLDKVDAEGRKVLKFRSTRARPLRSALVPVYDEGAPECTRAMAAQDNNNRCLGKDEGRTYLETYNCEYIKSPKPSRFARAMVSIFLYH